MTNFEIYQKNVAPYLPISRAGEEWLVKSGFFTAPASTKYHGSHEGGLFEHSLAVMKALVYLTDNLHLHWEQPASPYIVGFFHDICKIDSYTRNPDGAYVFNTDTLFKGHGEKSLMLLSTLCQLSEEEAACIRYHMGAFCEKEEWADYTRAIHRYPNVLWTHTADMLATHIQGL